MVRQVGVGPSGKVCAALALPGAGVDSTCRHLRPGVPARPLCAVSGKSPAEGLVKWQELVRWPPLNSRQGACITIGLKAPVVLSGAGTAGTITIGGSSWTAELELNAAPPSPWAATGSGTLWRPDCHGRSSALEVPHPDVLTNHDVVTIPGLWTSMRRSMAAPA